MDDLNCTVTSLRIKELETLLNSKMVTTVISRSANGGLQFIMGMANGFRFQYYIPSHEVHGIPNKSIVSRAKILFEQAVLSSLWMEKS